MDKRARALAVAITTILNFCAQHARASSSCDLAEVPSIVIGSLSMAVDFGFTANAIVRSVDNPSYPDAGLARMQIGFMVPQMLVTGAFVLFNRLHCEGRTAAVVTEAIPLAWSVALLGHGVWSLRSAQQEEQALPSQIYVHPPSPRSPVSLRFMPASLGPRSVGLRLQGRF